MSDETLRQDWIDFRNRATEEAILSKQVAAAQLALFESYESLSAHERRVIDALLAENLGDRDEGVRFHALAVIDEFHVASALPALRALEERLQHAHGPGARFEKAKVLRILDELGAS